jgi:hypothetical protein
MLLGGFVVSQAIATVARLDVAELVHERPRTAEDLAAATGTDPDALARVLRALASVGVFAHVDGVVHHTELSELLRKDVPGSVNGHAEVFRTVHYRAFEGADESFRTGDSAFEHVFGTGLFDWLATHPGERTEDEWRAVLGRGGFVLVDADPAAFLIHAIRG